MSVVCEPRPPAAGEPGGDWPTRLLRNIGRAQLVTEDQLRPGRVTLTACDPTPAELRTLAGLSYGLTVAMVADVYGLSYDTTRQHLRSCRFKLAAKNSTHAVALALRQGLIR